MSKKADYSAEQTAGWAEHHFGRIRLTLDDHVLTLTLARPDKRNAMDPVMVREIAFALAVAREETGIWAVVLAAEGDVFCSGADLKAFAGMQEEVHSTVPEPGHELVIGDLFRNLHKPCLAKVHGPVYAGGHLLIGGCTHVIATTNAVFGLPEVQRGLWPMQVMASLAEILPARYVLDWCMRGRTIQASEALEVGLLTDLVSAEELDDRLNVLLKEIKDNSPTAIRLGLQAWQQLASLSKEEHHAFLSKALMNNLSTADAREGIQAFREKRKPVWTGK